VRTVIGGGEPGPGVDEIRARVADAWVRRGSARSWVSVTCCRCSGPNDNASIELAAELLGHTDTRVTVMDYIQRSELVNPATAALLDRAFAKDED
jgi:hypothetical protein